MTPQEKVRQRLDWLFRQGKGVFPKLTTADASYRFVSWQADDDHRPCLYYEFGANDLDADDHKKRVPLEELVAALGACTAAGFIDRPKFIQVCPVAHSAGDCGYVVTGRCLELLEVAEYLPDRRRFRLANEMRAKLLLAFD
jgi:hypothetical protein